MAEEAPQTEEIQEETKPPENEAPAQDDTSGDEEPDRLAVIEQKVTALTELFKGQKAGSAEVDPFSPDAVNKLYEEYGLNKEDDAAQNEDVDPRELKREITELKQKYVQLRAAFEKTDAQRQIAECKAKHPEDFEDYREAMTTLDKQVRGVSIEQLYVLAKAQSAKETPKSAATPRSQSNPAKTPPTSATVTEKPGGARFKAAPKSSGSINDVIAKAYDDSGMEKLLRGE